MSRRAEVFVTIQTSAQSAPAPPPWLGEITLLCHHLQRQGVLAALAERVHFARRRFGRYEVIDFIAILFGYAISGERTLQAFYERLRPFANVFMALFGRERLPSRSALGRFLAALTPEPVEALRTLFLSDLVARPLSKEEALGGLWDRMGTQWLVFDVDGTREAARQRALPQTPDRPAAQRRVRLLCEPGYLGRKRGEVVRTRTTVLQAHTSQWLGTFGNAGNGQYREELRQGVVAIQHYMQAHQVPEARAILRMDGQYGPGRSSQTWQGSRMCCAARTTPSWIARRSKHVSICPLISRSVILKVSWCVRSMIVLMYLWGQPGSGVASS